MPVVFCTQKRKRRRLATSSQAVKRELPSDQLRWRIENTLSVGPHAEIAAALGCDAGGPAGWRESQRGSGSAAAVTRYFLQTHGSVSGSVALFRYTLLRVVRLASRFIHLSFMEKILTRSTEFYFLPLLSLWL